jgi:DNA-binding transcriptional LysR family regulator
MSILADFNLNRLLVFVAVVEAGSLTGAAARLGLTKTVVSAHLRKLEQEVGASLLHRTTRRLSLTDAGEAFYEASRRILHETEEAVAAAGQASVEPRGLLRVTAPTDYCASVLAPVAVQLRERYPALEIELLSGDRVTGLVGEGIDVAIRVGRLSDSSMQAVRLATFAEWLVASPSLLTQGGMPQAPAQLESMPFIALSALDKPWSWTFERDGERQPVRLRPGLACNTAIAVLAAAQHGGGLAILPDHMVAASVQAGLLVRVLPQWTLPGGGVHAVFPATRYRPQKTRVFVDAVRDFLAPSTVSRVHG